MAVIVTTDDRIEIAGPRFEWLTEVKQSHPMAECKWDFATKTELATVSGEPVGAYSTIRQYGWIAL